VDIEDEQILAIHLVAGHKIKPPAYQEFLFGNYIVNSLDKRAGAARSI
jgi:hypothetical protein